MAFLKILEYTRKLISSYLIKHDLTDINFTVEPSKPGFGDITCNVAFLLAKKLHKTPQDISQEIVEFCSKELGSDIQSVTAHPAGHINFEVDFTNFSKSVLEEAQSPHYSDIHIGNSKKINVEHTSVNPNKALHIGHVRNIVIGDIITRILKKVNYDVQVLTMLMILDFKLPT